VGVERDKIAKLPVNNPSCSPIRIFALYPEDRVLAMERVQAVANSNAEAMKQNGHTSLTVFIPLKPEL
jgi:hypothetical protein